MNENKQDRKKILVVLQSALHIRNFITSGLVKKMADNADVMVVIPQKFALIIKDFLKVTVRIAHIEEFEPSRYRKWWLGLFRSASIFSRRSMNHTYNVKVRERLLIHKSRSLFMTKILLRRLPHHLLMFLLSFIFDLERLSRKIYSYFKVNPSALELIDKLKPDLVLSSTVIHETNDIEVVRAAKFKGVPLTNFVASWDNLTSKGFFMIQPDHLLVWGQADKDSAISEQGFKAEQITITGAPHFDFYFNNTEHWVDKKRFLEDREIDPAKKIILFAGTSYSKLAHEPLIVKKLSEYLLEKKKSDVLIWYRPHPLAMRIEAIKKLGILTNVYTDDQIMKIHNDPKFKRGFSVYHEDLLYFKNLINSCVGAVSFFSTMSLEFALLKKPTVYINFHLSSKGKEIPMLRKYKDMRAHFLPMMNWNGMIIADNFATLTENVESLLDGSFEQYGDELQKNANTIAYNTDGKAQSRIINALLEK